MKLDFLHVDPQNTRLILVVAGWSAGKEAGDGIAIPGWDVAVIHDFTDFSLDTSFLNNYYTVYLFAWSLGVYAAGHLIPAERITAAFALNGTMQPVNDTLGIPVEVYEGTTESLDTRNLLKFRIRMAGGRKEAEEMLAARECQEDDIENLREQLRIIQRQQSARVNANNLPWVRAYLSRNDRIFPFDNMKRYWQSAEDVAIVELDEPHYVPLSRIVSSVITDSDKISRRFSKAASTYDTQAIAQYSAALKLAGGLAEMHPVRGGKVLEIGCGTGLFTREYARILEPSESVFVDITATGPFDIAQKESYFVEDAELWIERQPENMYDAIVSASAIQWFADIPRFLHLCHRVLKPGGILAISTFAPGNMEELDAVRPSPLLYPDPARIREWLERDFVDVRVAEDCIKVEFQSVRDMLIHLKHTGVGGSASSSGSQISAAAIPQLRSLTYRPLYLYGVKSR